MWLIILCFNYVGVFTALVSFKDYIRIIMLLLNIIIIKGEHNWLY